jgi:hypothetical protein
MKIIQIHLNEFIDDSMIYELFQNEMDIQWKLFRTKRTAVKHLETQSNSDIRIFWIDKTVFKGNVYYQLYETTYD